MKWIRTKGGKEHTDYPAPVADYVADAILSARKDVVAVDAPADWQPNHPESATLRIDLSARLAEALKR